MVFWGFLNFIILLRLNVTLEMESIWLAVYFIEETLSQKKSIRQLLQ